MLHRFEMKNCKTASLPINISVKLSELQNEEVITEKKFPYRKIVGCVNYIAQILRPDMLRCEQSCSVFEQSIRAAKHVMKYLKGLPLCYNGKMEDKLVGYCDSHYANDLEARKSIWIHFYVTWRISILVFKSTKSDGTVIIRSRKHGYLGSSKGTSMTMRIFKISCK